jgi:hypothetical protein
MTIAPIKPAVPNPTATSDQRMRVWGYLDKHFDDSAGLYLDGMSDQKIAEAVKVPRIIVERMREAAYGPIRINPEIVALRNELTQMQRSIASEQNAIDGLKSNAASLEQRLARLESSAAA